MNIYIALNKLLHSYATRQELIIQLQSLDSIHSQTMMKDLIDAIYKNENQRKESILIAIIAIEQNNLDSAELSFLKNSIHKLTQLIIQFYNNRVPLNQIINNFILKKVNKMQLSDILLKLLESQTQILNNQINQIKLSQSPNSQLSSVFDMAKGQKIINQIIQATTFSANFILNDGLGYYKLYEQNHLYETILQTKPIDEIHQLSIFSQITKCIRTIEVSSKQRQFNLDLVVIEDKITLSLSELLYKKFELMKKEMLDRNSFIDEQCRKYCQNVRKRCSLSRMNIQKMAQVNTLKGKTSPGFYSDEKRTFQIKQVKVKMLNPQREKDLEKEFEFQKSKEIEKEKDQEKQLKEKDKVSNWQNHPTIQGKNNYSTTNFTKTMTNQTFEFKKIPSRMAYNLKLVTLNGAQSPITLDQFHSQKQSLNDIPLSNTIPEIQKYPGFQKQDQQMKRKFIEYLNSNLNMDYPSIKHLCLPAEEIIQKRNANSLMQKDNNLKQIQSPQPFQFNNSFQQQNIRSSSNPQLQRLKQQQQQQSKSKNRELGVLPPPPRGEINPHNLNLNLFNLFNKSQYESRKQIEYNTFLYRDEQ